MVFGGRIVPPDAAARRLRPEQHGLVPLQSASPVILSEQKGIVEFATELDVDQLPQAVVGESFVKDREHAKGGTQLRGTKLDRVEDEQHGVQAEQQPRVMRAGRHVGVAQRELQSFLEMLRRPKVRVDEPDESNDEAHDDKNDEFIGITPPDDV